MLEQHEGSDYNQENSGNIKKVRLALVFAYAVGMNVEPTLPMIQ